jgi:nitroreductase
MESGIVAEDFNELVHQRRSVFPQDYTGEKVPDEVVTQILENARWAPTHKLTEPWRFIVFTGEGIKKLASLQSMIYKSVTEADGTYKENVYQKLSTKPLLSSHIIAVMLKRDERKSVPEIEEAGAVFCALQNMYLTATAYGVGAYFSTGGITYFEEAKQSFGLANEDRLLGFFHLGRSKKIYPSSKRKPLAEVCEWVR